MNSMIALVFKWVSPYILEQRETECVFILLLSGLIAVAISRIKRTLKLLNTGKDELTGPDILARFDPETTSGQHRMS